MSSDLHHLRSGLLPSDTRRAGRAISRYQTGGQVRAARIDTDADVALAKLEAATAATGQAMAAVTRVAQAQVALEQLAPQASARLNLLAEQHTLDVAGLVGDLQYRLRRL